MISSWPYYHKDEINAVSSVLGSGLVNRWFGNITNAFEREFAEYFNLKNALTSANGTLSLEAAYAAIDFREGEELITTPRSFVATASSALLKGAKIRFADVDIDSGNITSNAIEPLINSKTKAITVVHLGGWPADIKNIAALAKSYDLDLIEDCSQAHGAKFDNKYVGTFSDISTWSFCNDKIISTGGEGGMISSSNPEYFQKIWSYRDHGKDKNLVENKASNSSYQWLHTNLGSNIRMTELQSAIGRIQLTKLENWIKKRTNNAQILISYLSDINSIRVPLPNNNIKSAWYKFYCYVVPEALKDGWSRDRIIHEITKSGFPAFSGICSELYLEKCFKGFYTIPKRRLAVAKHLGETSLMFLIHPTITNKEMHKYASVARKVLKLALK